MIDLILVVLSLASVILFITLLALVMRRIGQKGIMSLIKRIFIVISVISCSINWILLGDLKFLFIQLILNFLFCFAYIIGFFGLPLTSVRVWLLLILAGKGNMKRRELVKAFTVQMVVKKCLYRLETSGEIERRGGVYRVKSLSSYFMIHTQMLRILVWLYRPIKI